MTSFREGQILSKTHKDPLIRAFQTWAVATVGLPNCCTKRGVFRIW